MDNIRDRTLSRRKFIKGGAAALGAISVCELTGGAGIGSVVAALASEEAKEVGMPHVIVKLWPGRSEESKRRLADTIVQDVMRLTGCGEGSVSVSIEEVDPSRWKEEVYDPLIRDREETLYKKPGYSM